MKVEEVLAEPEESAIVNQMASAPFSEVPRVIYLALDAFGDRVLHTLRDEWLVDLPALQRGLTVFLHYEPKHGFEAMPEALGEAPESRQFGKHKRGADIQSEHVALSGLTRQLYQARETVSSQSIQAEILRQGTQICPHLAVYVITEIDAVTHVRFLQQVVAVARAFLQRFEPVLVTGLLNLAEYEQLDPEDDRLDLINSLNTLLVGGDNADPHRLSHHGLERCYVATHEMISGRAVISPGELPERAAGFLAAHFLASVRQPMTPHQYLLFGRRDASSSEMNADCGLCDLFGYADLRFDLNHVLDWCAVQEAGRALREVFLQFDEQTSDASSDIQAFLTQELELRGSTLSIDRLAERLLEGIAQDTIATRRNDDMESDTLNLNGLQDLRRRVEEFLSRIEANIESEATRTRDQLKSVLSGVVDKLICSDPQGVTRAESLLSAIEMYCRSEIERAHHRTNTTLEQDEALDRRLDRSWFELATTKNSFPAPAILWGRLGLMLVLVVVAAMIGDLISIGLITLVVLTVTLWLIYVLLWLRGRLSNAYKEFMNALSTWQNSYLRMIAELHASQIVADLLSQFVGPINVDVSQAGAEWWDTRRWREKLTQAVSVCDERATPQRDVGSEQASTISQNQVSTTWNRELVVSQSEAQTYYDRLTDWQPQHVALEFLKRLDAFGSRWWRTCTAAEIVDILLQICRRLYETRVTKNLTGLEHHLLEISGSGEAQLKALLDSLLQASLPMARVRRLHGHWEFPAQRLLIVHDPEHSAFRNISAERSMRILGGARPQQVICLQTVHRIPVRDLAINDSWISPVSTSKGEGA